MKVAEVRGGQLVVKQEEPTRWITVEGGRRVPITTPKGEKPRAKKPFGRKERKAWRDKKRNESKKLLSIVDELVDAINSPTGDKTIEEWLDQQALFWQYSWANTILILSQKPDARQVAGYKQWQKLGRQVRGGERSIRILAPFSYKIKKEPVEGEEPGEEETTYRTYFNPVSVFDVLQTDGEKLLDFRPDIGVGGKGLLQAAKSYAEEEEVPLQFGPIYGEAGAYIGSEGIKVYGGLGVSHQAISLVHELSHRQLKHLEAKVPTSQAEAEAEATTFIVLKALGLPAQASNSAGYIKSHFEGAQDGEPKERASARIRDSLSRISMAAKVLIDGLSARLGEEEPTDPEDEPAVIKLYDSGISVASVQRGELIIKREGEEPTRWITVGGKKVPIKAPARLDSGIGKQLASEAIKRFGLTTDPREAGFILSDGKLLDLGRKPSGEAGLGHGQIAAIFPDALPEKEWDSSYERKAIDNFLRSTGAIRAYYGGPVARSKSHIKGGAYLYLEFAVPPTNTQWRIMQSLAEGTQETGLEFKLPRTRKLEYVYKNPTKRDIGSFRSWVRYMVGEGRKPARELGKLDTTDDLLKISQAELDTQTARLRTFAAELADTYAPTFHDTARKMFQQELEDTLLSGFREILARPGRGPKGTIGRTRMRSAIYDLLRQTQAQLGRRVTYLALEDETNVAIQNALRAYEERRLSLPGLRSALQNLLRYSYEQSTIIGKRDAYIKQIEARGEVVPASAHTRPFALTVDDRHRIDDELEDEYQYLTGFIEEAKRRRTEDVPFGPYVHWRGKLYAQALWGLEQYGVISELGPLDVIHWRINPEAESCEDCIRIAANGPYTRETLPTVPRRGDTRCLSNCQCSLDIEYAVAAA